MTTFFATVCLPPTAPAEVPRAVGAVMAPYDINRPGDWNPLGQWDRWIIHADAGYAYLVLPPYEGDRRLVTAATVPRGEADLDALGAGECYGGPRGLLDFDGMRRRAAHPYDVLLVAWNELTERHPRARPLAEFVARHVADPAGYSLEDAKKEHRAQPLVQDVARRAAAGDPHFDRSFPFHDPVGYFAEEHEQRRMQSVRCAVPGSALVTLDGSWTQAETDDDWDRANGYLDGLDPEAVVVDVRCHC